MFNYRDTLRELFILLNQHPFPAEKKLKDTENQNKLSFTIFIIAFLLN